MTTIFIATGGTGGHIIPARVLALALKAHDHKVFILADEKYKSYIKDKDGFRSIIISSAQLKKTLPSLIKAAFKISFGILQSLYYFLRFRPKYIVSFGGYATFPILIAALVCRKKIILHEQNAHLGKVNRFFAKFTHKIALTFMQTDAILPKYLSRTVIIGNLVRDEIIELNHLEYKLPTEKLLKQRDKMGYQNLILASEINDYEKYFEEREVFNILIIGGSGGAKIFSEILPKALFNLRDSIKNDLHISQQCRKDLVAETFLQYKNFNINAQVSHFFEDMAEQIQKAHLIIARSGSSSLAEFCIAKKPMILIPFAKSADNHQLKNAKIFEKAGAAILLEEKDFTINIISKIINNLLVENKDFLLKMSDNCAKIANLNATQNLVNLIEND